MIECIQTDINMLNENQMKESKKMFLLSDDVSPKGKVDVFVHDFLSESLETLISSYHRVITINYDEYSSQDITQIIEEAAELAKELTVAVVVGDVTEKLKAAVQDLYNVPSSSIGVTSIEYFSPSYSEEEAYIYFGTMYPELTHDELVGDIYIITKNDQYNKPNQVDIISIIPRQDTRIVPYMYREIKTYVEEELKDIFFTELTIEKLSKEPGHVRMTFDHNSQKEFIQVYQFSDKYTGNELPSLTDINKAHSIEKKKIVGNMYEEVVDDAVNETIHKRLREIVKEYKDECRLVSARNVNITKKNEELRKQEDMWSKSILGKIQNIFYKSQPEIQKLEETPDVYKFIQDRLFETIDE